MGIYKKQGLVNIEDVERKPLEIPQTIKLENFSTPTLAADDIKEFRNFTGTAFMKSVIDFVREKNKADVFFDIRVLDYLNEATKTQKNFKLYLEDSDNVNLFVKIQEDISSENKEEKLSEIKNLAIKFGFNQDNIFVTSNINELNRKIKAAGGINVSIFDLIRLKDSSSYVHEIQNLKKTKLLTLVLGKEQGLVLKEILEEDLDVKDIIDSPDNLLVTNKSSVRPILPEEVSSSPNIIQLQDLDSAKKDIRSVLKTIEIVVSQSQKFNKPALIAVDGQALVEIL